MVKTSLSCPPAYFDFDGQLFVGSHGVLVRQRQQTDLVKSIWCIWNQLPEEDLREKQSLKYFSLACYMIVNINLRLVILNSLWCGFYFWTRILHFLHVKAFWVVTWSSWTIIQVTLPCLPADPWPWNCSIILRPDRRPPWVKTETRHPQKPNHPAVTAYLLVLVKRIDDQLHHTVDFSLEGMFFRLLSEFLNLRGVESIQLDSLFLSDGTGEHRWNSCTSNQQQSALPSGD